MKLFTILLVGLIASLAWAGGFETGNKFEIQDLEGHIQVRCIDGEVSHYEKCTRETMFPAEFVYFLGDKVSADHVELVATHSDKTTVKKKVRYSSQKGRTKERVNLWVRSLFQKPLLKRGQNSITYQWISGGKKTKGGTFTVEVVKNAHPQYCPDMVIQSSHEEDCIYPQRQCDSYFRRLKYRCN